MALQAGLTSKRRDAEVPKTRPIAELRTERGVNGRAGEGAEKRIGSPSQTKGILRPRDTGNVIDLDWLTQSPRAAISVPADSRMTAKFLLETQSNVLSPP